MKTLLTIAEVKKAIKENATKLKAIEKPTDAQCEGMARRVLQRVYSSPFIKQTVNEYMNETIEVMLEDNGWTEKEAM